MTDEELVADAVKDTLEGVGCGTTAEYLGKWGWR